MAIRCTTDLYTATRETTLTNSCGPSHERMDTPGLDWMWVSCDRTETMSKYANVLGTKPDSPPRSNLLP